MGGSIGNHWETNQKPLGNQWETNGFFHILMGKYPWINGTSLRKSVGKMWIGNQWEIRRKMMKSGDSNGRIHGKPVGS